MSTTDSIKKINNDLRNRILNDLLAESLSLIDLSKKYKKEITELYALLKSIEININQTLNTHSEIFPPVDDQEWVNMSEKERLDFYDHLEKDLKHESTPITLDNFKKMREDRKNKK